MRNKIAIGLASALLMGTILAGCGGSNVISSVDACRTLNLAKGASIDLALQQYKQDPNDLTKFLPPTPTLIAKYKSTEKSLTDLATQLGTGDKADLAKQFAQDLQNQLQVLLDGTLSMEAASAISSDASRVVALCGF